MTVLANAFAIFVLLRGYGVLPAPIHLAPQIANLVFGLILGASVALVALALVQSIRRKSSQVALEGLVGLLALVTLFDGFHLAWPIRGATTNVLTTIFAIATGVGLIGLGVAGIVVGVRSGRVQRPLRDSRR